MSFLKLFTLSLTLGLAGLTGAQAQEYSTLKTLRGYQPTILESPEVAQKVYNLLPTEIFTGRSGCFQRAHQWSYMLNQKYGIKSMKVFLFFTHRYQREFNYNWFYHVAPVIPVRVQQADGSYAVEERVFDPTFVTAPNTSERYRDYDSGPISIERWIKYFIYPDLECPLVENYADYEKYQEQYYCYIMKTPMFTYIPANLETETRVRAAWDPQNLDNMKLALPLSKRNP